ncbi:hypothetical protein LRS74_01380 [Streptomyces sp. LX-29]|uniref:hypothetical protein n=1 Tax=Streptomyces sp. LX-29 TaxID=2900152 RepID=UPI00240E09FA|nr:hypothetical protein [Streptomyces sp. LX-29]WFB05820.1 hypothetical protein LRS74_01380 [Streptomyces sp. LX-29]
MAAPDHNTAEPWEPTSEFTWTDRAYDLLEQNLLHAQVDVVDGVLTTKVWGRCPRCAGQLHDVQVPTAVGDFAGTRGGGGWGSAVPEPPVVIVDVTCGCGVPHLDAPEGTTGCGVTFRVELVAEGAPPSTSVTP